MRKVMIYTTGGTIEKSYNEFDGSLRNRESFLKDTILKRLRLPNTHITVTEVLAKDSLDMNLADRLLIWENVKKGIERGYLIVVLHGTDTMAETARIFHSRCPNPGVPVVFTGAMRPPGFEDSDATQNVTEALLAAKIAPPGHYVCFHGELIKVPNVEKNRERGTFQVKQE